jgi:hypothetical protein
LTALFESATFPRDQPMWEFQILKTFLALFLLAMDVANEIIGHEEEVLEEQLIADDAAFYNEEYVEVEEGNEHYFVEEGGIVNVDDSDQAQFIQHSPQGHYVDVPYARPYGQNIPQVPRHQVHHTRLA